MNQIINWQNPHHTYFIVAEKGRTDFFVNMVSENMDFKVVQNPDFSVLYIDTFGIDHARDLGFWVIGKPFSGDKKIKFIVVSNITQEAQNALLKTLEEPNFGSFVFFLMPSIGNLCKTLLSRIVVVYDFAENKNIDNEAKKFLSNSIGERLAFVQKIQKSEDKEKIKDFVRNVERIVFNEYSKSKNKRYDVSLIKNVINSVKYSSIRGSSSKMILEYLACILPMF